ncbi:HAD hydrolase-like protein [Candidatus Palauibacter sp.]|uniref:HAD hydrolase-like protein n=1 Tax=Candidatus Palauibacter sp. TaxID=3101350 RepID=UPI003B02193C
MSATWVQTSRRLLPRLRRLFREIRPTFHLDSVSEMSPGTLRDLGVEAVLWDVDGTLMGHHEDRVDPALAPAFRALLAATGLRHAIVSNCQEERFAELGTIFPKVPAVLGYETETGPAFHIRRGAADEWRGRGTAGGTEPASTSGGADAGTLRPIRKPSRRLVRAALEELDLADRPGAALMVGDQYFTDIASANLAGVRSVKVRTRHRGSFPAPVRLSQRLEGVLYRLKHGRPRTGLA